MPISKTGNFRFSIVVAAFGTVALWFALLGLHALGHIGSSDIPGIAGFTAFYVLCWAVVRLGGGRQR